jgi:hypothetical protein
MALRDVDDFVAGFAGNPTRKLIGVVAGTSRRRRTADSAPEAASPVTLK